ncbi:hypothetical protein [Pirellulimonas nuda]|nr:hypothetical protein [Pirellulimonas nuda]
MPHEMACIAGGPVDYGDANRPYQPDLGGGDGLNVADDRTHGFLAALLRG